ncbi:hypothetical protein [Pedobacter foliorum]|uniref:hypothetical protein n=1 Tax=Pedobacter foliorum TaxID=2739058 RepID=UPI0015640D99|nr:hypothetical protein [Pedobacter foliorum]NRF37806.1 hypothetical protein [Pedobacter foliorum]
MRGYKFLITGLLFSSFAVISYKDCKATEVESSMRYISNDRIKLGIDLALGGAVTYLSDQENGGKNMINSFDWGRQIQMSYYSGPWPYIGPNGERPTAEWEGLGWNPIQSGDAGGHRSKVISFEKKGNYSMLVRSIPMQWPHKTGVPGECIFECLYTLKGSVVTMKATIINNRSDKTQYTSSPQEMPAIYTNGNWYKVVSYLGDKPFEGKPTTTIVDKTDKKGWPWVHFYTPENWVALLDDKGYGIGVFQPEVMTFNSGFHPNDSLKGFGGEKDVQTGHIAPIGRQILDHNIKWTYETSLILGTVKDIRGYAKKHWQITANPRWNFKNNRENWYYSGSMTDSGFPLKGGLDITFKKNSALVSPVTFWKASETAYLEIEAEINTSDKELSIEVEIQPTGKSDLTDWLNWTEGAHIVENERKIKAASFPESQAISSQHKIVADGTSKKYRINLSDIKGYTGAMKNLKIKFLNDGKAKIKSIQLNDRN